jgi:hypothetical protein
MKINEAPRISVNKLGEYIYATPARKKRILLDAKFPSEIVTTRYAPVQNAAIEYFSASIKDIAIFERVKRILEQKTTTNDHQKEKVKSCIEALTHLTKCATSKLVPYIESPGIKGYKDCKSITINGVLISLRPEILLLDTETNQPKGAIKLAFSKGHFLTIQEGHCIAGLIKSYLENALNIKCNYKDCITLDVFSNRIIYAPVKNDWTLDKIKNACDDIRLTWPSLQRKVA